MTLPTKQLGDASFAQVSTYAGLNDDDTAPAIGPTASQRKWGIRAVIANAIATLAKASTLLDDSGVPGAGPTQADTTDWLAGRLDPAEAAITANATALVGKADSASFLIDSAAIPSGEPPSPQAVWRRWDNVNTRATLLGTWDASGPSAAHPNGEWKPRTTLGAGADATFPGWSGGSLVNLRANFVPAAVIVAASALYTAAAWDDVPIDTSGGSPTNPPRLPATPADGTRIRFSDPVALGSWSSANPALIGRADGTATINGFAVDGSFSGAGNLVEFKYRASLNNWQRRIFPRNLDGLSPTSAKGDTLVRSATTLTKLAVGTDGQVLTANSAASLGVDWETPASSSGSSPSLLTKLGPGPAGTTVYYSANIIAMGNSPAIATAFLCYFFDLYIGVATKTWSNLGVVVATFASVNIEMAVYPADFSGTNVKPGARVGSAVSILPTTGGFKTGAWSNSLAPGRYMGRIIFDATGIALRGLASGSLANPLFGFVNTTGSAAIAAYSKSMGSQVTAPATGEDITDGSWTLVANTATTPVFFLS